MISGTHENSFAPLASPLSPEIPIRRRTETESGRPLRIPM
jgi:hypothetical protein